MNIKSGYKLLFCLIVFAIKAHGDDASFQEHINVAQAEGSVAKLSALASECETIWPSNATLYFQSEDKIAEALALAARTNPAARQELEKQIENILGKRCPEGARAANACFKSRHLIIERFARVSISIPDIRSAEILAKFLGEVRTVLNTNYHFTLMSMNVMPPVAPKGQMVFSGMGPNAITDTNARAAYEKAIDENAQRDDENDLQLHTLPEINKTMTTNLFIYFRALLAHNPEAKSQANSLAALAHLTKDEQQQLQ
jgi:hypothetical protein